VGIWRWVKTELAAIGGRAPDRQFQEGGTRRKGQEEIFPYETAGGEKAVEKFFQISGIAESLTAER